MYQAGQHVFQGGERVTSDFPFLPKLVNPQSDLCPIKQTFSEPVAHAPTPTTSGNSNIPVSNLSTSSATAPAPAPAPAKCSDHIPNKKSKNYQVKYPLIASYPVNRNGVKSSNDLIPWEKVMTPTFDLIYDRKLDQITATVIVKVNFVDAVEVVNGVQTIGMYDAEKVKDKIQTSIPRTPNPAIFPAFITKIEDTLNHEMKYLTPIQCNQAGGCSCKIPMFLKVKFVEKGRSHRAINLFPATERANTGNWSEVRINSYSKLPMVGNTENTNAHEVGHFFGFVDEYYMDGGMIHKMYIDPNTQSVDLTIPEPVNDWKRLSQNNLMGLGAVRSGPLMPNYY